MVQLLYNSYTTPHFLLFCSDLQKFRIFASTFTNVNLLFNALIQLIMGKVVGLVGAASGKIGNLVYAVTNGIQTARVYQPMVSNPKSALQTMQRARGNLAGRISSFTPRTAIMGLGVNNRARRGEFLRNILKNADVVTSDDGYKAKIDNNLVLFSKGSVGVSYVLPSFSTTANAVTVDLVGASAEQIPAELYDTMTTRIVVMVYDLTTQDLVGVVTQMAVKPKQGEHALTRILTSYPSGYLADVYAIPMSTGGSSAAEIDTELALLEDNEIAARLSVNKAAVIFSYGHSQYLGQTSFTPAP